MAGNDLNTTSLLHFDGNLTDGNIGGGAKVWTAVDGAVATGVAKFGSASLDLTTNSGAGGTGAHTRRLSTPVNADFDFLAGDFTIDCWMRYTGANITGAGGAFLAQQGNGFSDRAFLFGPSGNQLRFVYSTNGTNFTPVTGGTIPNDGAYHHVAVIRAAGQIYFAVDGVLSTPSAAAVTIHTSAAVITIGTLTNEDDASGFQGYIDELRVSRIARWTNNFTPPTSLYGADYTGINACGTYTYTGKAIPRVARSVFHARGAYNFFGQSASLFYGKIILIAATGAYALHGGITTVFKNGREIAILIAETGRYLASGFAIYLVRAISQFKLGDPPTLKKTRQRPPQLED